MSIAPTSLYKLYDRKSQLLYVGIAGNPGRRFQQHRGHKPWWGSVQTIKLRHFKTRAEAEVAEIRSIKNDRPLYNITHAGEPRPAAFKERYVFYRLSDGGQCTYDQLHLEEELLGWSCVQECSGDGKEQLKYWIDYLKDTDTDLDQLAITWGIKEVSERLPFQDHRHKSNFLEYYTWPVLDGVPINWASLPLADSRFPELTDALGWRPGTLQSTFSLRTLMQAQGILV